MNSQQPRVSRRVKKLQKYKFEEGFYWKAISWLKDANNKRPMVRDGQHVSVKDIVRVGTEYFPGLEEIRVEEGIGYALFHSNRYKQAKKTLKRFILHLVYVYPRLSAKAVIKKK